MKISKVLSIVVVTLMLLATASNFVLAYDPSNVKPTYDNADQVTGIGNKIFLYFTKLFTTGPTIRKSCLIALLYFFPYKRLTAFSK